MNIGQANYGEYDIYTTHPGKFEANRSERVSEMLYSIMLDGGVDDEVGSVGEVGLWYGRVDCPNRRGGYILGTDEQGIFHYIPYYHNEAEKYRIDWNRIVNAVGEMEQAIYEPWQEEGMEA